MRTTHYPRQPETLRRYRLFDGKTSTPLRYRYYRWHQSVHEGATLMMRWARVGETVEVVDVKKGRMLAQYTRERTGIRIHREPIDRPW